jgi:hypothetical protein
VVLLFHKNDEAIAGLVGIKDIKFSPFSREFSAPFFGLVTALLPLAGIAYLVADASRSIAVADAIRSFAGGLPLDDYEKFRFSDPIIRAVELGIHMMIAPAVFVLNRLSVAPFNDFNTFTAMFAALVFFGGILFWWSIVNGMVFLAQIIARGIGGTFSHRLNRSVQNQIELAAWGSDAVGEKATAASAHPWWCQVDFAPLPDTIGNELSHVASSATRELLEKVRAHLTTYALTSEANIAEAFAKYLTWNELIHTSYFRHSGFCRLVAYAITQSPGFCATSEFLSEPDFPLVAQWYRQIMREVPGATSSPS